MCVCKRKGKRGKERRENVSVTLTDPFIAITLTSISFPISIHPSSLAEVPGYKPVKISKGRGGSGWWKQWGRFLQLSPASETDCGCSCCSSYSLFLLLLPLPLFLCLCLLYLLNSVTLSTFTHHHHPSHPELFSSCSSETLYLLNDNSPFLPHRSPGDHHSVFLVNLTTLGSSYEWNHIVFVLLSLPYFT